MRIPRAQRSSLVPDAQASPQAGVSLSFGVSDTNRLGSSYSVRRPPPPACTPRARRAPFPVNAPPLSHNFFGRISLCLRGLQNVKNRHGQDADAHTGASVLPPGSLTLFPAGGVRGRGLVGRFFPSSAHSRLSGRKPTAAFPSPSASGPSSEPPAPLHRQGGQCMLFYLFTFYHRTIRSLRRIQYSC